MSNELITLDPRDEATAQNTDLAARATTLHGRTIGLLSNNKPNSEMMLGMIAHLIEVTYSVKDVVEANKGTHRVPAPPEMIENLAARCDVVITATAE